jgi:hypothetical protein
VQPEWIGHLKRIRRRSYLIRGEKLFEDLELTSLYFI